MPKSTRGFASPNFPKNRQKEICSKGGKSAHAKGTAYKWTSETGREASLKRRNLR